MVNNQDSEASDGAPSSGEANDQPQNPSTAWDAPLDTQNVHYIVGRIDAKVGDLEKSVGKIETDLRTLLYGGIAAFILLAGAGWNTHNRLSDNIATSAADTQGEIKGLESTVLQINERLIRLEVTNSETLSRIEQKLGALALKDDEQSNAGNVTEGIQKPMNFLDKPEGALPVEKMILATADTSIDDIPDYFDQLWGAPEFRLAGLEAEQLAVVEELVRKQEEEFNDAMAAALPNIAYSGHGMGVLGPVGMLSSGLAAAAFADCNLSAGQVSGVGAGANHVATICSPADYLKLKEELIEKHRYELAKVVESLSSQ